MRLTYLAYQRLPTNRACGFQITKMCSAFAAAGLGVTLVHPRYHRKPQGPAEDLLPFYGLPPGAFAQYVFETFSSRHRLSHGRRPVFWATMLGIAREHRRYVSTHVTAGDIVYTRDLRNLPALVKLRDRLGFKLVCELHGIPHRGVPGRIAALSRADLVVPISGALRDAYEGYGLPPARMLVEHDAFDLSEFEAPLDRAAARGALGLGDCFMVGFLGSFTHMAGDKGAGQLVDAMAQLADLPEVSLQLVGSIKPELEAGPVRERATALGIPPERIGVHGRVGRAEVRRWLAAFDVCINPLPDNDHNRRASPLKIFEYMAAERAIVATDLAGMAEVLHHERNALLVPPGDPSALAAAIRRLHDDPALARRIAAQARQDVAEHTWQRRVERILARL